MLFNEPKLLKCSATAVWIAHPFVSVLFNEPKLLKSPCIFVHNHTTISFSALQRAEIAEIIVVQNEHIHHHHRFSALQRAEIAEIEQDTVLV